MTTHAFVTLDVFAARPFEGNQLAVFPDASGIPESAMLPITREFRFSETTFVLPGARDRAARVRIFTPGGEAAFAGHPLVGTACVLADRAGLGRDDGVADAQEGLDLLLDVPAGTSSVRVEQGDDGLLRASVATPQPLSIEHEVERDLAARVLSLPARDVLTATHRPTSCGMGRPFVITEVAPAALDEAVPDAVAFAEAHAALGAQRFAVLAYARGDGDADGDGATVRCRMFSPLTGTVEDPATGSANVALAGLLLSLDPSREELRLTSRQGERMGRPSTLELRAWRAADGIRASVAGTSVMVTRGELTLP